MQEALEEAISQFPSQAQFCKAANLSAHFCRNVRTGQVKTLNHKNVKKLARFADVGEYLFVDRVMLTEMGLDNYKGNQPKSKFKWIDGHLHKWCRGMKGKCHPGKFVPIGEFYPAKTDLGIRTECKTCTSFGRSERMLPVAHYAALIMEIENRVGIAEASRRIGISTNALWNIRKRRVSHITRPTARKVVAALAELRKSGLVRHRDSIHAGASMRGIPEKIPKGRGDFYRPHGDADSGYKRKSREREAAAITE